MDGKMDSNRIILNFEKGNGLITTIIQDYYSNEVLMLAYITK